MTPKKPEITRPLTERLTELTSDLRRTQELAKGGLLPLERRSLAMLEELGLEYSRQHDALCTIGAGVEIARQMGNGNSHLDTIYRVVCEATGQVPG